MKKILLATLLLAAFGAVQALAADAPLEFQFKGVDTAKKATVYSIKILSDKTVKQVDIQVKWLDKDDQKLMETTVIWQNIVKSVRQTIKKGETYVVDDEFAPSDAVKAEGKLLRVWFEDGSKWETPEK